MNRKITKLRFWLSRVNFFAFIVISLLFYVIIRALLAYLTNSGWRETIESAIANTADNLIAGLVFAVAVWAMRDSVRRFLESDRDYLTKPIASIHDLADAMEQAVLRHKHAFTDDISALHGAFVCIISPMHFSKELVDRMCKAGDPQRDQTWLKISNFNTFISQITDSPRGSYDIRVYGRTGTDLDTSTRNEIIHNYTMTGKFPGTSELGLHFNRDEVGVILIGECNPSDHSKPIRMMEVIKFEFDDDYSSLDGSSCIDSYVAGRSYDFQIKKVNKLRTTNQYFANDLQDPVDIKDNPKFAHISSEIEQFFLWRRSAEMVEDKEMASTILAHSET